MQNYYTLQRNNNYLLVAYIFAYTIFAMSDEKKKKAKLDPTTSLRDAERNENGRIDFEGEYGKMPEWVGKVQDVDMVNHWLTHSVEQIAVNAPSYEKIWSKGAENLIKDRVKKLDKKWTDYCIDSIKHDDTDFTDLDASEYAIIKNVFKQGTKFSNANFTKVKIHGGDYTGSKFDNCTFEDAQMGHLEFKDCTFTDVNFDDVHLDKVVFKDCKFTDCSFESTRFHESDLFDCEITDCVFTTEHWYNNYIAGTTVTNSEFNKSMFSSTLIDDCTFKQNSFLKNTYFCSQIQKSEYSDNQWLKVGIANTNDIHHTSFYNDNFQQCNFSDSVWKFVELQNCTLLKNDITKLEMHDSDFVDCMGIGDSFATTLIYDTNFVDCDFASVNCTGTDFFGTTNFQNCTLDKMIYAFARMPEGFDESQLKRVSQAQIKPLDDKDLKKDKKAKEDEKIGYPAVNAKIVKLTKQVKPTNVTKPDGVYTVTGDVTLDGTITAISTEKPPLNIIELNAEKNKLEAEAEAKVTITNALADIEINLFDEQKIKMITHLGIFDLTVDSFIRTDEKIYLKASLSTNSEKINKNYKDSKLEGSINFGFDLVGTKLDANEPTSSSKQEKQNPSNRYAFETFVIGIVAISSIIQPELSPLIIGLGGMSIAS